MSKSQMPPETQVTAWLKTLIKSGGLYDAISRKEALLSIAEGVRQANFIPSFGIDYQSRLACADAGELVLNQLTSLQIISVDKSISLTTGEALRPDILCFNPESRTLVVFELKRAAEAERQTVTELGGYEQELRNLLPFLGNCEICFVVVATDWAPLLNHSVGALNAWSGKRCLALRLSVGQADNEFGLTCHLPEAWHLTGSLPLAPNALQAINVYLTESEPDLSTNWPPRSVITAMDVIARAGDRSGSHGFMMLWKDVMGTSGGAWCLTLCGIDPYVMYAWWREHGLPQRNSDIVLFFDNNRSDMPGQVPVSVFAHLDEAWPILNEYYDLELGDELSWEMQTAALSMQALPKRFEFWGSLGQYARKFVCNPAVRDNYMPYLGKNDLDWTDPDVALPLIQNLAQGTAFAGGQIRCSDAFNTGIVIGTLIFALTNAELSEARALELEPLVAWSQYEALRYAVEMKQITEGAHDFDEPMPTLTNSPKQRLRAAEAMKLWILTHFLGAQHPFHQRCFALGCDGPLLFGDLALRTGCPVPESRRAHVLGNVRGILKRALAEVTGSVGYQVRSDAYNEFATYLYPYLDIGARHDETSIRIAVDAMPDAELISEFPTKILKGVDNIIPVVFHQTEAVPIALVDWDWFKAGIQALYEAGNTHSAVIRHLNGTIGTGAIDKGVTRVLVPISNPREEVYFYDHLAGCDFLVKVTWDELIRQVTSK